MSDTLWCPFMGEPCMGKSCACAVYSENVLEHERSWWCGMVPDSYDRSVTLPPVKKERMDD